jgi:hypothetical protein
MMPGPIPKPNARRRNAATIPTTSLPAGGRKGSAPKSPTPLAKAGRAWWSWAWKLPQACAWSGGDLSVIARRASLEDDLAALAAVEGLDFSALGEDARQVRSHVQHLAGLATGKLNVCREMRELDDRLGLTPKGRAALRWTIVDDTAKPTPAGVTDLGDYRAAVGG